LNGSCGSNRASPSRPSLELPPGQLTRPFPRHLGDHSRTPPSTFAPALGAAASSGQQPGLGRGELLVGQSTQLVQLREAGDLGGKTIGPQRRAVTRRRAHGDGGRRCRRRGRRGPAVRGEDPLLDQGGRCPARTRCSRPFPPHRWRSVPGAALDGCVRDREGNQRDTSGHTPDRRCGSRCSHRDRRKPFDEVSLASDFQPR
jgi:hypothetical protein